MVFWAVTRIHNINKTLEMNLFSFVDIFDSFDSFGCPFYGL
jgi:hypothetical protein